VARAGLTQRLVLRGCASGYRSGVESVEIAVVDDEGAVRTALRRLLRLADFAVSEFASGEDFLASLDVWRPHCVVLDVHMPGLSGFDVCARMRAANVDIPPVFITASDERELDQQAAQSGGRLLRKPFSGDDLVNAIDAALR
jgi:FixJ family two-component response regulator